MLVIGGLPIWLLILVAHLGMPCVGPSMTEPGCGPSIGNAAYDRLRAMMYMPLLTVQDAAEVRNADYRLTEAQRLTGLRISTTVFRAEDEGEVGADIESLVYKLAAEDDDDCASPVTDAILYFHGGGYTMHDNYDGRLLIEGVMPTVVDTLGACRAPIVFAPLYKLAVPHTPPTFELIQRQALTSYLALLRRGYRVVALGGDSAGGGLALSLTAQLIAKVIVDDVPLPQRLFLLSPWVDLDPATYNLAHLSTDILRPDMLSRAATAYLGVPARRAEGFVRSAPAAQPYLDARASPVFTAASVLALLPPTLLIWGEAEIFSTQIERLQIKLVNAGVRLTTFVGLHDMHVFPVYHRQSRQAADACATIAKTIIESVNVDTNEIKE